MNSSMPHFSFSSLLVSYFFHFHNFLVVALVFVNENHTDVKRPTTEMQITRYCGKQAAVPSINYLIHRQQTRSTDKLVQLSSYFRPSIYAHTYKLAAINGNDG